MSARTSLVVVLVGFLPASAAALTVDSFRIDGGPRGDRFRVTGRFTGVAFEGAAGVELVLDRAVVRLPIDAFRKRKRLLTHRGGKGPGRVASLRLDLRRGRFDLSGDGWAFGTVASPVAVSLGNLTTADCGMAVLDARGRRKASRTKRAARRLALVRAAGAPTCGGLGRPRSRPVAVTVGEPTPVEVEVDVAPGSGVDPATLRLFRTEARGATLCTLAPRGADRFGCTITVSEPAATVLSLAVDARAGGARVLSPGYALPVVPPPGEADVQTIQAANAESTRLWSAAHARLGDTLAARMETIRALAAVPGILTAELSPTGTDVLVRYTSGWQGALILNRLGEEGPAPLVRPRASGRPSSTRAAPASRAAPAARPHRRGLFRSCGGADGICCTLAPTRSVLEARDVLVWVPGFFRPEHEDSTVVRQKFQEHSCLGHQLTSITGRNADVASIPQLLGHSTVAMSTHGVVNQQDRVAFCTGERIDGNTAAKHRDLLKKGLLGVGFGPAVGNSEYVCVSADYLNELSGRFPAHSIVYASYCFSAYKNTPGTFRAQGAGTYYGFDRVVHGGYTHDVVAPQLFDGLLKHLRTTERAYAAVSPKVDYLLNGALFLFQGEPDTAYVGLPGLSPKTPSVDAGEKVMFEADVQGEGSCNFRRHWKNDGEHGDLEGGNDVENGNEEIGYTAKTDTKDGVDPVGVEVLPPDSDEPLGVACGEVIVNVECGDGFRQGLEECDGADDAACPGKCNAGCGCDSEITTTTTTTTTTTNPPLCNTSSDCGPIHCCTTNKTCCPDGGTCDGPAFGGPAMVCGYVEGYMGPPSPIDGDPCGPSTPDACPLEAMGAVSYGCRTCLDDGKFIEMRYTYDDQSGTVSIEPW
jgi:hypothetical protein